MAIRGIGLKESMNKFVQTIMPLDDEKEIFNQRLIDYLKHLQDNKNESEEYQKNILKNLLEKILPNNFINTSNRIDLAIYNGKSASSSLGVLFEYKSLTNKSEMMSKDKFNTKAFQEIVAYYLTERLIYKNLEIKKIIITNGLSWFIIEAKEVEKYFFKNKKLVDLFTKFYNNQLSSNKTDFLYSEVVAPEIDKAIEKGITIAHFDLRDALKQGNKIEIKKNNLTQIYRFFTAENLLNKEIFTDSNKLNKAFYDELLYLMGLEEIQQGTSKVISRLKPDKRQHFSFVENIIGKLELKDVLKEKQEEIAIQLTVIWMNRILFLKLLESQLVLFNKDNSYRFLTFEKLFSFEEIYNLFFAVLARKNPDRNSRVQEKYSFIPYLNSSLFEETELEMSRDGIGIDRLPEGDICIFDKTILKGMNKKRKKGKINFLEYLFEFLDSYDFSTSISHHQKSKNDLINASVLGLIFEKINGYKDGSFFTPGHITMYMSKKSIRTTIVDKINEHLGWSCKSIEDIKFEIRNIQVAKEVNKAINNLKICDPAVGSGHFLVSILNEIIALKSELNVLFDSDGNHIGNLIQCYVINDELIIQDMLGNNFIYQRDNKLSEQIQKAIFDMKRHILENSLFGVDINPSSVNICRLRLWIELLKSSYYYEDKVTNEQVLTTLPNIDINIKVGDSLLHKFDINYEFDMRRTDFKEYLALVKKYKSTNDKKIKAQIWDKIEKLKNSFDDTVSSPELKRLKSLEKELGKASQISLFDDTIERKKYEQVQKQVREAQKQLEIRLKNPIYSGGMEWRMEFPEILEENGKFIGFDLIIGNPPYIFSKNQSFTEEMKNYYIKTYPLNHYQANTFGLFLELAFSLVKKGGGISFIIPNTFLTINQYKSLRHHILNNFDELTFINSKDRIFDEASVDVCIIDMYTQRAKKIDLGEIESGEITVIAETDADTLLNNDIIIVSDNNFSNILLQIEKNSKVLEGNFANVKDGLKVFERGKGTPKQPENKEEFDLFKANKSFFDLEKKDSTYRKFLSGRDLQRYKINWTGQYLKYGKHLAAPRNPEIFEGERILIARIPVKSNYSFRATLVSDDFVHEQSIESICNIKSNPFFLIGVINSKILSFYTIKKLNFLQRNTFPQMRLNQIREFPIPVATDKQEAELAQKVERLMAEIKKENHNQNLVESLNEEVNEFVMDLFCLAEKEKKIIREFEI
ncbi:MULTISPECIES: TaqI-like C-terminal specificity domain-containing protein [Staphylococcus]|uniref:type IIG restriction enzyme/methyltransferase n=1 Tax=Staphylococcus TaxID=1279 RepID=UPI001AEC30BF|nr:MULTISPECIES: TaqI-like C-terminal specificity domain-containing protein [Staphylococcus]MEB8070770.1 Eco57I restriction-modification methylase domain-containing protein [Staphylococcus xylosus]